MPFISEAHLSKLLDDTVEIAKRHSDVCYNTGYNKGYNKALQIAIRAVSLKENSQERMDIIYLLKAMLIDDE